MSDDAQEKPKRTKRKKTYVAAPKPSPAEKARYEAIVQALSGQITVTEGARRLGMSRNHFQSVMHRGLEGLLEGIRPKEAGRPGRPEREVELESKNEELRQENEELQASAGMIDRALGVLGQMLRGEIGISGRRRRKKAKSPTSGGTEEPGSPEAIAKARLEAAMTLRSLGAGAAVAALIVAADVSTVRRWWARERAGRPLLERRGPAPEVRVVAAEAAERVEAVVRETHGLAGADALRHAVPGVSRRQAAEIKKRTCTSMEAERKAACGRVLVSTPGVVRGFDAMHIATTRGWWYALIAADAAVPYRTSAPVVLHYDGPAVAAALDEDFSRHGAPLVARLDRARAHGTSEVDEVMDAHGVLVLHGPPRHPRYYGQLERQNREHRAWLDALGVLEPDELAIACTRMIESLSSRWPRRTLGWCTAADAWNARPAVVDDRDALRQEVDDRAARLRRSLDDVRGVPADLAERLAIEQALIERGYLRTWKGERAR